MACPQGDLRLSGPQSGQGTGGRTRSRDIGGCALPDLPNDTYVSQGPWHDALVNASIPWDDDDKMYDQCKLRRVSGGLDNDTVSCDKWVYSKDPFESTFVTDINLVCDDKALDTYASMILMAGMLVGSLTMGILSDAYLCESPRWLLQKGRTKEAAAIFQKIGEKNKLMMSPKTKSLENIEIDGKGETVWHMFMYFSLLIRCLIIFFNWSVASIVYYGLSLNVGDYSGDIYLNFFLSSAVEMASYVFCLVVLDITGRKYLLCFSMLIGGNACLATIFPVLYGTEAQDWITMVLSLIGKFGASASFAVIYIYSAELFPTMMRNSGLGLCSFMARVGGILAPYIGDISDVVKGNLGTALPLVMFGGLSVAAGLLVLFLPETSNKVLPDTVEDAKNFG
ncbi:organic cation transporter protein, partial [Plakobranchus ocellatus]